MAAVDVALDREVAIEYVLSRRPEDLRRFEREVRHAGVEHSADAGCVDPIAGPRSPTVRMVASGPRLFEMCDDGSRREVLALPDEVGRIIAWDHRDGAYLAVTTQDDPSPVDPAEYRAWLARQSALSLKP